MDPMFEKITTHAHANAKSLIFRLPFTCKSGPERAHQFSARLTAVSPHPLIHGEGSVTFWRMTVKRPYMAMGTRLKATVPKLTPACTHPTRRCAPLSCRTAMKKLRIVTGFRVRDRSRGRFSTPADFPLQDGCPYRGLRVRRECLGVVHRSRAIF
jgi:hypothetical protein